MNLVLKQTQNVSSTKVEGYTALFPPSPISLSSFAVPLSET